MGGRPSTLAMPRTLHICEIFLYLCHCPIHPYLMSRSTLRATEILYHLAFDRFPVHFRRYCVPVAGILVTIDEFMMTSSLALNCYTVVSARLVNDCSALPKISGSFSRESGIVMWCASRLRSESLALSLIILCYRVV